MTIEAVLYDKKGGEIYRASTDEVLIHNLLPKESSAFRIDFNEWENKVDSFSVDEVSDFVVFARSTVTDEKLYKFMGTRELSIDATGTLVGSYDNYGNKEISIPQILTQLSNGKDVVWVDVNYIDRGIRPQREKPFKIHTRLENEIFIKARGSDSNILINGAKRSETKKLLPSTYDPTPPSFFSDGPHKIMIFTNGLISTS